VEMITGHVTWNLLVLLEKTFTTRFNPLMGTCNYSDTLSNMK